MLNSSNIKLYRDVEKGRRYYYLYIYKNLFSEYILERRYGNIKYKRPTGVKTTYFQNIEEAIETMKCLIDKKRKKGYKEYYI